MATTVPRVVLFQPEIPPNTGNVARSCAATCSELHLIAPLGFQIDDRSVKRAGLDYWPYVNLTLHDSWALFLEHHRRQGGRLVALSRHARHSYTQHSFAGDDWLLFGRESSGLPSEVMAAADARLRIPLPGSIDQGGGVRSLNLSVAVGVVLFEALRQLGQPDGE